MKKLFELSEGSSRIRDISQIVWEKKSGDPSHSENRDNADWQAGYLFGCFSNSKEPFADLNSEWKSRGKPKSQVESWRSWKAGYWAGRYTTIGNRKEKHA